MASSLPPLSSTTTRCPRVGHDYGDTETVWFQEGADDVYSEGEEEESQESPPLGLESTQSEESDGLHTEQPSSAQRQLQQAPEQNKEQPQTKGLLAESAPKRKSRNGGLSCNKMIKKKGKLVRMFLAVAGPAAGIPKKNGLHIEKMKNEPLNKWLDQCGCEPLDSEQWATYQEYPFEGLAERLGITEDKAKALCEHRSGRYARNEEVLKQLLVNPAFERAYTQLVAQVGEEYDQFKTDREAGTVAGATARVEAGGASGSGASGSGGGAAPASNTTQMLQVPGAGASGAACADPFNNGDLYGSLPSPVSCSRMQPASFGGALPPAAGWSSFSDDSNTCGDGTTSDTSDSAAWSPTPVAFDNNTTAVAAALNTLYPYGIPVAPPPPFNTRLVEAEVHNFMRAVGGHEAWDPIRQNEHFLRIYRHMAEHLIPSIVRTANAGWP